MSALTQITERIRPRLADRTSPLKTRLRLLWSSAKLARDLGSSDVVRDDFTQLARDTGLTADLGRHGAVDVEHVVRWASRGMNPFEVGELT